MPTPTTLSVFALAGLALIVVPGPNVVFIVTRGIAGGRRAGVASAFGVELGTLAHVAAAAAGVSALVASSALAFAVVKYLGAAYLLYLGLRALLARDPGTTAAAQAPPPATSTARLVGEGALVNLLNPKVALFFLAFLPQFVDPARGGVAGQVLVLGLVLAVLGLGLDLLYALGAGTVGRWISGRPAALRRQRRATGVVYLALGAAAALTPART